MIPTSDKFNKIKDKSGAFEGWVVCISNNGEKHYYSTVTMRLHDDDGNAIVAYPYLIGHSGIANSVDVYLGSWSVGNVTITLDNLRYKKDAPDSQCLSDVLTDIEGEEVVIYAVKGNVSTLNTSDQSLVKKFVGIIFDPITYDDTKLVIRASSKSILNDLALPPDHLATSYPDAPDPDTKEAETKTTTPKIPIVYGAFTHSANGQQGLGLAVAVPIDNNERKKSVVADRPISGIYSYWFNQETVESEYIDGFQWFKNPQANTDDNGRSTITPGDRAYIRLYPCGSSPLVTEITETYHLLKPNPYFVQDVIPVTGVYLVSDIDDLTYTSTLDSQDYKTVTGPPAEYIMRSYGGFTFPDLGGGAGTDVGNEIGRLSGEATIDLLCTAPDDITLASDPEVRLYYGRYISANDQCCELGTVTPGVHGIVSFDESAEPAKEGGTFDYASTYGWEPSTHKTLRVSQEDEIEFYTFIVVLYSKVNNGDGPADEILNNQPILNVHSMSMVLEYEPVNINSYWAACSGVMFDPWIEADGRSTAYLSGQVIEDPVYICEDLLRYYGDLGDDDIDTTSFDAAANSGIKARINLHKGNERSLNDVIRQLCEQSTARFCYTTNSIARMIPLDNDDPTTDRIIPWSHIKDGKISVSKTRAIYNVLAIENGWRGEVGCYRVSDFRTVSNTNSITQNGERRYGKPWPNTQGDSVDHVAKRLIGDGAGGDIDAAALWANRHTVIAFDTAGFIGIDLELGDYIELEAASVDPQFKLFGGSWDGVQFLVFDVKHGMKSSRIKALCLYEDPLMIWDGLWLDDDASPLTSTLGVNIPALHDGDKTVEACYYFPYPDTCSWSVGADFGCIRSVNRLKLYDDPSYANHPADTGSGWGGIYPTADFDSLQVYTSNDNATWTLKETIHPVPREPEGHQYPCSIDLTLSGTYECRYIKLHCDLGQLAAVNGGPIGIAEIEAFNE